jgi:hypothetical protein
VLVHANTAKHTDEGPSMMQENQAMYSAGNGNGAYDLARLDGSPGGIGALSQNALVTSMISHPSNVHCILVASSEFWLIYMAMRHCKFQLTIRADQSITKAHHGLDGLERRCCAHACTHKRRTCKLVVLGSIGVLRIMM